MSRIRPQRSEPNVNVAEDNDAQGILSWNKLRKSVKTLPASSLRISNPNKESDCYRIVIKQIETLSYQPKVKGGRNKIINALKAT